MTPSFPYPELPCQTWGRTKSYGLAAPEEQHRTKARAESKRHQPKIHRHVIRHAGGVERKPKSQSKPRRAGETDIPTTPLGTDCCAPRLPSVRSSRSSQVAANRLSLYTSDEK